MPSTFLSTISNRFIQIKLSTCLTSPGQKLFFPWLYYQASSIAVLESVDKLSFSVNLDRYDTNEFRQGEETNRVIFYLAKYEMDGTFLGFEELKSQFNFCTKEYWQGLHWREFGTNTSFDCEINLESYVDRSNKTIFYELFLQDPRDQNELFDVPVQINNVLNKDTGLKNESETKENLVLTRRFFLFDNVSSIEGFNAYVDGKTRAKVIRYASKLTFFIEMSGQGNRIYPPLLKITYETRELSSIETDPAASFALKSIYSSDMKGYRGGETAILIVVLIVAIFWCIVKSFAWFKNNPSIIGGKHVVSAILNLIHIWSGLIGFWLFWFLVIVCAYWYFFYKMQYSIFTLLPSIQEKPEEYSFFFTVYSLGFILYTVYIFGEFYKQASIDIFLIDWEVNKEFLVKDSDGMSIKKYKGAWRVLFIANQYLSLSVLRNYPMCLMLIIFAFIWQFFSWGDYANELALVYYNETSPTNPILMMFVFYFIIFSILACYLLLKLFVNKCIYPTKQQDFVDLCSVSNISIFMLTEYLKGYYIHGHSPLGRSETTLEDLMNLLEEEGAENTKDRGLMPNDSVQTFEVYISKKMMLIYRKLYELFTEKTRYGKQLKQLSKEKQIEYMYEWRNYINAALKERIIKISTAPNRQIHKKSLLKRLVDLPPINLSQEKIEEMTFFKDENKYFTSVTLIGMEFYYFIWEMYVFLAIGFASGSMFLGVFVGFLISNFVQLVRKQMIESNLSEKAMIDEKLII